MFIGRPFYPVAEDGQTRQLGYDLASTLSEGEIIIGVGTAVLTCVQGADSALSRDPSARFSGLAQFSGTQISQAVSFNDATNALAGNLYTLMVPAATSFGQILGVWAYLRVEIGFGVPIVPGMPPPASSEIVILPTPPQKFILPTVGGYAGQDFPTVDQGETRLFGFDISSALSPQETITAATFTLTLLSGTDETIAGASEANFFGPPTITGGVVQQLVAFPQPLPYLLNNLYALGMSATTSFNQQILAWGRVTIGSMSVLMSGVSSPVLSAGAGEVVLMAGREEVLQVGPVE